MGPRCFVADIMRLTPALTSKACVDQTGRLRCVVSDVHLSDGVDVQHNLGLGCERVC